MDSSILRREGGTMGCPPRRLAYACGALAGILVAGAAAQDQQIYRYLDPNGRIIYSDHVPPADARSVEAKKLSPNLIETDQVALAAQRAQERYPLTLYTFPCGDVCDRAEALLNRRGVPYTTVNVQEQSGAEKLKKLTGELQAPVLQAGDKLLVKGFSDVQWQMLLDNAGYPAAPPTRRAMPTAEAPKGAAAPVPATAAPAGGYPKN
jgi:glutaredoxin